MWQPTPVFLLGKSHGPRSLVGYSSCSRKELDMAKVTEHILAQCDPIALLFPQLFSFSFFFNFLSCAI